MSQTEPIKFCERYSPILALRYAERGWPQVGCIHSQLRLDKPKRSLSQRTCKIDYGEIEFIEGAPSITTGDSRIAKFAAELEAMQKRKCLDMDMAEEIRGS